MASETTLSLSHNAATNATQPPRHSPRHSPRNSSKTRKHTILSLLGILTAFSIITNVFFWMGNPFKQNQARHYGLGGMDSRRMEAAWSPPISRDDRLKRVFRDGKLKRRTRESVESYDTAKNHNLKDDVRHDQRRAYNATFSDRMQTSKRRASSMERKPDRKWKDGAQHRRNNNTASSERRTTEGPGRRGTTPKGKPSGAAHKKRKQSHDRHGTHHVSQSKKTRKKSTLRKKRKENHNGQPLQLQYQQRIRSFRLHPVRKMSRSHPWSLSLPAPAKESIMFNRLVQLDGNNPGVSNINHDSSKLDYWLAGYDENEQIGNTTEEDLAWRSQTVVWDNDEECVPMSEWQKTFHPTCNSLHEMDISLLLNNSAFSLVSSKGHWRNAWKVDMAVVESHGSVSTAHSSQRTDLSKGHEAKAVDKFAVVKSLKYIHDPNEEVFELSRVDAVSLDVLSQSRFTINIYGFCGTSSVQEFAGGDLKGLLPKLDPLDKLRMAAWVAEGVADIHAVDLLDSAHGGRGIDNPKKNESVVVNTPIPPLIHNDINMDNVLLGYRQGVEMPILNDFNIAVFRKKDATTGEPCHFRGRFANPQWMSPEQQTRSEDELSTGYLDEKIDIYALGNIFYKIAVGNSPWKYDYKVTRITPEMKAKIARAKLRGAKPKLPPEVRNSTDSNVKAVLTAMERCYRNDAELRPSARQLAGYLKLELDAVETRIDLVDRFDFS